MKDSPDAQDGVRKLARDALLREMRNTSESGTSGDAKVSNDKMAKLLRDRRPALEADLPARRREPSRHGGALAGAEQPRRDGRHD